jgi:hypothetical protein
MLGKNSRQVFHNKNIPRDKSKIRVLIYLKTENPTSQNQEQIGKALATLAIEKALLDVSRPTYDKVLQMLYSKYHCYLPDCYDHPEYLSKALKTLFGNAGETIVESIRIQLEEFVYKKPIARFLNVVCR